MHRNQPNNNMCVCDLENGSNILTKKIVFNASFDSFVHFEGSFVVECSV